LPTRRASYDPHDTDTIENSMNKHTAAIMPGDRLADFDFDSHNAQVRECWAALAAKKPTRTPVILGTNTRYFLLNPRTNISGLQFEQYTQDPDTMFDTVLGFQRWSRFNLLQDQELGMPDAWNIGVDFQNYYDAAWFGCPVEFMNGEVPDTRPIFEACPERVMEKGIPDPFGGIMDKALRYYEHFKERAAKETFLGAPINVGYPGCGMGTDGVLTTSCSLFGATFVCSTMASDPDRMKVLFDFVNESLIAKMTAWRKLAGVPIPQDGFGSADDSVALISKSMYREQILPHHKKLYNTFGSSAPRGIHLCGNATRHFVTLRDELNIMNFDTGFPVDFGKLRQEVGPNVRINGGPHVELLRSQPPDIVRAESKRILESGIREGGEFVLREGNNLAPGTPLENTEAMYQAAHDFGRFAN